MNTPQPLKVLLIDDDEDDYVVTQELLEEAEISRFELDWVCTYDRGLAAIAANHHQVYLLDYRLGPDSGLELLKAALAQGCSQPLILLTGLGDHAIDQAAMKLGAADYLVKGQIDTPLLERSIRHALERKQAETEQKRLMEALEAANQELQDFAYVVSHDLKAPLRGISSLADWLTSDYQEQLDQTGQDMLHLIKKRSRRMNELIDGVLRYSRLGRVREQRTRVDLNQVVTQAIEAIAPPHHIAIIQETPLPEIICENIRMQQVFQNLLSNAVKYMDKPQGQAKIRCQEMAEYWQFEISDNGPGIAEKHFDRIFQLFQTLVPSEDTESTGVGLSLVKKIIEMHQGHIWLTSQPGSGTTFYFQLPLKHSMDNA
jgi:signal transduction histidine kinase